MVILTGFLQAVSALGTLDIKEGQEDYISFLEPPFPQNSKFKNYVIRVGLKVEDKDAETLSVLGVGSIDCPEYPGMDSDQILPTYLYKPVSGNVSQSFTPLYRLGKGSPDGEKELLSETGDWAFDKQSRFFKIRKTVLQNYETEKVFQTGNVELILAELEERVDELSEYWTDKKSSYILLFGIDDNGRFLYPGEINAFVSYFKNKVSFLMGGDDSKKTESKPAGTCSLCDSESTKMNALDGLFPFATFDKENFLPGAKNKGTAVEKVFPICQTCYIEIAAGKGRMENAFKDTRVVPGYILYVIPELIGPNNKLKTASSKTQDFFKTGLKSEGKTFELLSKTDEYLVYHFLFIEENQAQQRIHFMIEDVPPSRLKRLQKQWKMSCECWKKSSKTDDTENNLMPENDFETNLDYAFQQIYYIFKDLAGRSEQEQKFMREEALQVMVKLLNQDYIETKNIKQLIVSRLPGLFANPEWIAPKGKVKHGKTKLIEMARILDFINRSNQTRRDENEIGLDE